MQRSPRLALCCLLVVVGATALVVPVARRLDRTEPSAPPRKAGEALEALEQAAGGPVDLDDHALDLPPGRSIDLAATRPDAAGTEVADRFGEALGVPGSELRVLSTSPGLASTAVRLQQSVGGVPVFGGQVALQLDDGGDLRSAATDLSTAAADVDTTAATDPAGATQAALRSAATEHGVDVAQLTGTTPESWIYDPTVIGAAGPQAARLVWRVDVTGPGVDSTVLVDADAGFVVLTVDHEDHAVQRFVCDANGAITEGGCEAPYARTEQSGPSGVGEVDQAFVHLGLTYDFFWSRFGRDSLDGNGLPLRALVRACSNVACQNASWSSEHQRVRLAPGYAVDDIVGHELTHGLVDHTADLFSVYQSGAINESLADVFGELIDLTNGLGNDSPGVRWDIGEDRTPDGAIRNMADPPVPTVTSPQYRREPTAGNHDNAGPGNRAAALMVDGGTVGSTTILPLGVDAVAAIHYEALTTRLTSGSDYADLARALPRACTDLSEVGVLDLTLADCAQVEAAVGAVQMAAEPPTAPIADAPVCPGDIAPSLLFEDDFEDTSDGAWETTVDGGYHWTYPAPAQRRYATSGTGNLWGSDPFDPSAASGSPVRNYGDARIAMKTSVFLPANTQPFLRFDHAWFFEHMGTVNRDGGVVEYLATGNSTWQDAGPLFVDRPYNGTLNAATSTNPLNGRPAFVGHSGGYTSSRLDLSSLQNRNIRFRFRLGADNATGDEGWFVDDVQLYLCPEPAVTVTQSVEGPSVTVGDTVDLTIRIANTGNVPLTGITVTNPEVPDCEGPVSNIAVGSSRVVTCSYATVDPDDLGTFENVVTVGANELSGTTASNPVSVLVLEPGTPLVALEQVAEPTTVGAGQPIDLDLTITNIGNVALTGLVIHDPQAPECDGPVTLPNEATELAIAGRHTVECTHTVATPGTWTNAASVTTNELPNPTAAEDLTVEVLDVTDPSVTITSPADGLVVNQGQSVVAAYSCLDDQPGGTCVGTVEVGRSVDTATPGEHQFAVTATDAAGNDTTVTHTYVVASRRPDLRIRQGAAGEMVGNDLVNATGASQNRTAGVARGQSVTFFVTLQNDGSHAEAFRVRGQPSTTNYTVAYWSAGREITEAARTGSYTTPVVAVGGIRTIRVVVTVGPAAPVGSRADRLVTATSRSDPNRKDVVRFIVRRA